MRYIYPRIDRLFSSDLIDKVDHAAGTVHRKLVQMNMQNVHISEYNQRAIKNKLANPIATFQVYSYLLCLVLADNSTPLNKITFVEYGGGAGVLSLLAKTVGIGTVIYNDIYDVSCRDAQTIANTIRVNIDSYVCGDIDDLIDHANQNGFAINAIASWDVIEHIYDIEIYLKKLKYVSKAPFRVVFGSGANKENPLVRRKLERKQIECENKSRNIQWGHKDRDTLESYFQVRKGMIEKYAPDIPPTTTKWLAKNTRGLIEKDIRKTVDEFKVKGSISFQPDGRYNTCDPHTGNWAEHLMDTNKLKNILVDQGFQVSIMTGYYPDSGAKYKQVAGQILNVIIRIIGQKTLALSPYYVIYANSG